jgi:hypothetical protein
VVLRRPVPGRGSADGSWFPAHVCCGRRSVGLWAGEPGRLCASCGSARGSGIPAGRRLQVGVMRGPGAAEGEARRGCCSQDAGLRSTVGTSPLRDGERSGLVTAHPVDDHDPDDPVGILSVLPEEYQGRGRSRRGGLRPGCGRAAAPAGVGPARAFRCAAVSLRDAAAVVPEEPGAAGRGPGAAVAAQRRQCLRRRWRAGGRPAQVRERGRHPSVLDVQISLDGATAEVNEAVRGAGSYATALRAMRHLVDAGFTWFKISVV